MVSYYHWGKLFHQMFVLRQHALIFPLELSLITGIVGKKKNINRCKDLLLVALILSLINHNCKFSYS